MTSLISILIRLGFMRRHLDRVKNFGGVGIWL